MQSNLHNYNTAESEFRFSLRQELQAFAALCGDILDLARQENQALARQTDYLPQNFDQKRRNLLQPLETALGKLRHYRKLWSQFKDQARSGSAELQLLLTDIQNLLTRILLLDRENQQSLLRQGLVPIQHLPPAAAQQPHFVAKMYQKNNKT